MSRLSVYHQSHPAQPNKVLSHADDIAATLAEIGVGFAHWPVSDGLLPGCSVEAVASAYQESITRLQEDGYASVEVLSVKGDQAPQLSLRERYLAEHSLAGQQSNWCIAGRCLFSLHVGDYVYEVLCERGDLLTLPAGCLHWLDIGERPNLIVVRLFAEAQGWTAQFSGDGLASQFPRLEEWT